MPWFFMLVVIYGCIECKKKQRLESVIVVLAHVRFSLLSNSIMEFACMTCRCSTLPRCIVQKYVVVFSEH